MRLTRQFLLKTCLDGHHNIYQSFSLLREMWCSTLLSAVVIMNPICNIVTDKQMGGGGGGGRPDKEMKRERE